MPWRAVDDEGEVLDVLVQKRRNKHAALKLLRRLLKNQGIHPERCCQSNGNLSPVGRNDPNPRLALAHDLSPLSQGS